MQKINFRKLKKEYLNRHKTDLKNISEDLKSMKKLLKNKGCVNYPGKFQLFKNKINGYLYLTVTTIDFDLSIINYSQMKTFNEQMQELFPEYTFFKKNSAGGFNLFPGMIHTIYGFSSENDIIPESVILEF